MVAEAFYRGELENEIRLLVREDATLKLGDFSCKEDMDREGIMERIEDIRAHSIYPHQNCTSQCQERGEYYFMNKTYI